MKILVIGEGIYTSAMVTNWACSFILIVFGLVRFKLSSVTELMIFYLLIFSLSLVLLHKRYTKESFYKQLSNKYNHERNINLKGWVVLLFFVISFVFFFLAYTFRIHSFLEYQSLIASDRPHGFQAVHDYNAEG